LLHRRRPFARTVSTLAVATAITLGCSDDDERTTAPTDPTPGDQVPGFSLLDVNETSATADERVSPRDHLGRVSAWYFGHAT